MNDAHGGFWSDYNRRPFDRGQILVTEYWSRWMTGIVTVFLTVASPYLFELFVWLFERLHQFATRERNIAGQQGAANQPLLGGQAQVRETVGTPWAAWISLRSLMHGEPKEWRRNFLMAVITVILSALFVASVIAGILSAKIASDKIGLTSSKQCGIWEFDEKAGRDATNRADLNNYEKEARASYYAKTCYKSPDESSPFSCGMFYNQSIAFSTKVQQRCPFTSSSMCLGGLYSAVTFDTGLVDASVIGVNSPKTHKFRRFTSCSPLNMSEPYIVRSGSENSTTFKYYYGHKDQINATFQTSGNPFEWLVPLYSVNAYFSSLYHDDDYWHPLPDLSQPPNTTLTIMFVTSTHIYHTNPSLDPIFYANEPQHFNDLRETYYYNSDPRARPFACVDSSEVCSPDGQKCWSMRSPVPHGVDSPPTYWLMKWSLENSNTYDSIKWRLGSALLAQESISQYVSRPLSPVQWQLEASQLFATSLARIQYDALEIATGEDREKPGYLEVTPDEAKGHLCGLYKFKTTQYTNVNLAWFILLPLLSIMIFVLTWKARTIRLRPQTDPSLIIDVLIKAVWDLIVFLVRILSDGVKVCLHQIGRLMSTVKGYFT